MYESSKATNIDFITGQQLMVAGDKAYVTTRGEPSSAVVIKGQTPDNKVRF